MRRNKKNFDGREESEEEKYKFMIEQIRPQRKRNLIQYLKKICIAAVLALVFGIVAGVAFVAMQNIMWTLEEESAQETMSANVISNTENSDLSESVSDEEYKDAIMSLKDYQYFCEKAALVGERCNQYIVEIKEAEGALFENSNTEKYAKSGAVFKKTVRYCYILTNSEGTTEKKDLKVVLSEAHEVDAEVFGIDASLGIAVLRIEKEKIPEEIYEKIKCATVVSELKVKLNTPIIAIGNPSGAFGSVEFGNVIKNEESGSIVDGDVNVFCTNIKGNKNGNGFVTDIKGRIVGIITTSFIGITGEENCAFMGSDKILPAINRLVSGKEMPYLGIKGVDVKEGVAEKLEIKGGVYISDVISGSPAYKAKIRVADVIVKINEKEIHSLGEMRGFLSSCSQGEKLTVCVKRSSGKDYVDHEMEVTLK